MVMSDEFLILYFSTDLTQERVLWHYLAQKATAKTDYNRKPQHFLTTNAALVAI